VSFYDGELRGTPNKTDAVPWAPKFTDIATWRAPVANENTISNAASGTLYLSAFPLYRPVLIDGLAWWLRTAPTSGNSDVFVALYDSADGYFPGNLVAKADFLGITSATGTGIKAALVDAFTIKPGVYYWGLLQVSDASATLGVHNVIAAVARQNWWFVSPSYGTGSSPSSNSGNDGTAFQQTSLSVLPSWFNGVARGDANAPGGSFWLSMRARNP
jgi:hypothetical protein